MVNKVAEILIKYGAIEFGDFTLASGAKSRYYIDIKTAATNPELLAIIGREIAENFDFEVVAGVAVGAVPIAVAVSLASGKPYCIIRKEEKSHGKSGKLVGDVRDKKVLLVEDVTTSGGSVIFGLDVLRENAAKVDEVVTIVDREQGAYEKLKSAGVRLSALVKASEIVEEES
ncbi:MAG: orotate phosphoribosyltransferase [Methanomicrobiaceae archaeon]|nr:orotate phosphoribosyltransferase [Methanomicrobiaceae archaeon]